MDTQELHTNAYERMPVAQLRKMAQGKITGIKGMRKADLVTALIEYDANRTELGKIYSESAKKSVNAIADDAPKGGTSVNAIAPEATESAKKTRKAKTQPKTQAKPAKATSGHEKTAKTTTKRSGRKMCAVCGQRPVDRKTQGRDSTMCTPCFEYAGWENHHSDGRHDYYLEGAKGNVDEIVDENLRSEIKECPVCQGNDPAKKPVERRKSKAGETHIKGDKPKAFADAAKSAGWTAKINEVGKGKVQVIATATDGQSISLVWDNGVYLYDESAHTDAKNRTRKVRNASAAKKVMALA